MTPLFLTDSHAHLDREVYDEDRGEVLDRARKAGVATLVNVALGPEEAALSRAYAFALATTGVYLAVGVHPHDVGRMTDETLSVLRGYAGREKVVAIGEIGLDYHYDHSPRDLQRRRFGELLSIAVEKDLPVVIHSREAFDDTFAILEESGILSRAGGVLHCFGGTAEEAVSYMKLGAHIGFSGILTFKKAVNVHEAARSVAWDRILIETDAPYLAPEPHRGKRNEPAHVVAVAEALSKIKGVSLQEAARITTENAARLFRLPVPPTAFPPDQRGSDDRSS
jgi:TatD DNase family protein